MDVERTIEHLLQLHARAEQRMDRADQRMDRAEQRMDRTDRQIQGIQKLIRVGMKMIVDIGKAQKQDHESQQAAQKETTYKLNALIDAQQRSDATIEKLAALWLKRPPNGKGSR